MPVGIKKVAVMVDPTDAQIRDILAVFRPDYIQLHGSETPERVRDIRASFSIPIIKAFKVRSADDVSEWGKYSKVADMMLFDARAPESALPGGNGLAFDWNLIKNRRITSPWLLSGGLNATNVAEAIRVSGAKMVDVSSSIESSPGVKDPALIKEFIEAVKKA
ncbi:MAG: phosphoribosylanthranilate isomerase [Proteobacteria bacterium]|nr:phosphoribosylanthranilate isomerase [Pseudomonadota bacterium]